MAWIEVHDNLREHRKTYELATLLKAEQYAAVGLVVSLWTWAINHAQDGDLSGFPAVAIANACHWKKKPNLLIDALVASGFVTDTMQIHDWDVYAGKLIDRREANARRNREARAAKASRDDDRAHHERITSASRDGATVPNPTVPNHLSSLRSDRESTAGTPASPPPEPKKPERHKYGEYKNVLLTDEELEKLKDEYPRDYSQRISRLSEYMASKGVAYKNHLATIRAWAKKDKDKPFTGKRVGFQAYDQTDQRQDTTYDRVGPDLLAEARAMTSKENE